MSQKAKDMIGGGEGDPAEPQPLATIRREPPTRCRAQREPSYAALAKLGPPCSLIECRPKASIELKGGCAKMELDVADSLRQFRSLSCTWSTSPGHKFHPYLTMLSAVRSRSNSTHPKPS